MDLGTRDTPIRTGHLGETMTQYVVCLVFETSDQDDYLVREEARKTASQVYDAVDHCAPGPKKKMVEVFEGLREDVQFWLLDRMETSSRP